MTTRYGCGIYRVPSTYRAPVAVRRTLLIAFVAAALQGCGSNDAPPAPVAAPTAAPVKAPPKPPSLCRARLRTVVGQITDPTLDELSGLTRIGHQLWAVEDSGADPVLIALSPTGAALGSTTVTGATEFDWEDLAGDGRRQLFVGDIGDNERARDSIQVYRVTAPVPGTAAVAPTARFDLRYPDGAHDAEALLADTERDQIIVITKEIVGTRSYVASMTGPATATLRQGRSVPAAVVTGASLSADGRIVAVRGYRSLSIWRRHGTESLVRTLAREPCVAPANLSREGQGEAVALSAKGRTALTVPEGAGAELRLYAAP